MLDTLSRCDEWIVFHAERTPDRIALVEPARRLRPTWAELAARVEARAAHLVARGVEPGARVATLVDNRIESLVLQAACARIGAILAPLNTRLSYVETLEIVEDCAPKLLYYDMAHIGCARWVGGREGPEIVDVEEICASPAVAGPRGLGASARESSAEETALILYTSGSTGTPRGVMLSHRSLYANHRQFQQVLPIGPGSRNYCAAPLFHAAGLNVLTGPLLLAGGTTILARDFDPERALRQIVEEGATCAFMVPAMWRALLACEGVERLADSDMEFGVTGGAPAEPELVEALARYGVVLQQGYGLTEAGPSVSMVPHDEAVRRAGSVGRPAPGVELRLRDGTGRVRSISQSAGGSTGVLEVRGPNLMQGYWRRPGLTAEKMGAEGWLSTGDIARVDDEGFLYIVGRVDDMIITGGENVHPVEVERVLSTYGGVEACAVFGVPDSIWGQTVCAAVVVRDDARPSTAEMRAYCRASLAGYKCPRRWMVLGQMPRTTTEKVDRARLRDMMSAGGMDARSASR